MMTDANLIVTLERQNQQGSEGENWRRLVTARERYIHMLEHRIYVDCTFVVGPEAGERQEFQAHRLQLSNASPVFAAMLLENMRKVTTHERIRIPDLSPHTFQLLLSHVYTDEAGMRTFEEAHELLVAADKYQMIPLSDECVKYINNLLKPDNVWESFRIAMMLKNESLLLKFNMEILRLRTTQCLATQAFLNASEECVSMLLAQDELNVENELQLVTAAVLWARNEAKRRGLTGNDMDVRTVLVPRILPQLRLLTLTPQQFVNDLRKLGDWLSGEEQWAAMKCILNQNCESLPRNLSSSLQKRIIPKPSLELHSRFDQGQVQEMLLCEARKCCRNPDSGQHIPCLHSKFEFKAKRDCQLTGVWLSSLYKETDPNKSSAETYITNIDVRVVKCGDIMSSEVPTNKTLLYYNNAFKTRVAYNSVVTVMFPGGIPLTTKCWYAIEVIFHNSGYYKTYTDIPATSYINGVKFSFLTSKSSQKQHISRNHQTFKAIIFSKV